MRIALRCDANVAASGHSRRCRRDELSHLTQVKTSPASPPIASATMTPEPDQPLNRPTPKNPAHDKEGH